MASLPAANSMEIACAREELAKTASSPANSKKAVNSCNINEKNQDLFLVFLYLKSDIQGSADILYPIEHGDLFRTGKQESDGPVLFCDDERTTITGNAHGRRQNLIGKDAIFAAADFDPHSYISSQNYTLGYTG